MTGLTELLDAVVASLRGNAEFLAALGSDVDSVQGYGATDAPEYRDPEEHIAALPEKAALVIPTGISEDGLRGPAQTRFRFAFLIACKVADHRAGWIAFQQLIDGESIEDGLRWFDTTIHVNFDPPEMGTFTPVTGGWNYAFSLIEIGG